jgi:hypothetical protein
MTTATRTDLGHVDLATARTISEQIQRLKPGFELDIQRCDYCEGDGSPERPYSALMNDYRLTVKMSDPAHGNRVVRFIKSAMTDIDLIKLAEEMKREIKQKAKDVRARIRVERQMNAE